MTDKQCFLAGRVSDVTHLGHGSLQRLMKLLQAHPPAPSSSGVTSLAALVGPALASPGRDMGVDIGTAIQQLQAAPQLVDLEEWTQWGVACEPTFRQLRHFLTQHGRLTQCLMLLVSVEFFSFV